MEDELIKIQPYLFNFSKLLTKDKFLAEDLLQETNLRILDKLALFRPGSNFKGWCARILYNIFINDFRKNSRTPVQTVSEFFCDYDSREVDPFIKEDLAKQIEALSPIYQESIKLYLAGYKYQEIADLTKLPIGTIKSRIFIAKQKLKQNLKEYKFAYS